MGANEFATDGAIDSFENRHPQREYEIRFDAPEFTSVCPMTGQTDFGTSTLISTPAARRAR